MRYKGVFYLAIFLWFCSLGISAYVDMALTKVDMARIAMIESEGEALAYNEGSGARGLYQITPVCLKDFNNYHSYSYCMDDMFDANMNREVAKWYLGVRIPQLLKHYGLPVDTKHILWAYNAGIGRVVKVPSGT